MGIGLALAIVAFLGLLAAVRLAPSDPAVWHVDVAAVEKPARPNNWLVRDGGDAPAVVLPLPPEAAFARLREIALAWPRTEVLVEDADRITFVTRSAMMGWPDYTTVAVVPDGAGSRLTLFARARFGYGDMGVNRARAEAWLADLAP
jgi:uncharacterized protein (DUF1499 family)